jgi:hypothetical protein
MNHDNLTDLKQHLVSKFIEKTIVHKAPKTIYELAKLVGWEEAEVYKYFNSIEGLEEYIAKSTINEGLERLKNDNNYLEYAGREKTLAFYYTWLEILKCNRSYILKTNSCKIPFNNKFLTYIRCEIIEYAKTIIKLAEASGEIASRPPFNKLYPLKFYIATSLIFKCWINDTSNEFEKTDACVEKTINFLFDTLATGAIDSGADLFKHFTGIGIPGWKA